MNYDDWTRQELIDQIGSLQAHVERLKRIISRQEDQLTQYSWTVNPDRMGGQFTDEEIQRARDNTWP